MSDLGNKEILAKNLAYYMTIFDVDRNKICSDLDIPYTTLSDWLNAKKYPRIDKIEMLSLYFDINKSDLIEDKNKNQTFDKLDILYSKTKDILSDDDRATLEFIMQKTIDNYEKSKNNNIE